ncbi:hypothetical protein [Muriicola sp.]
MEVRAMILVSAANKKVKGLSILVPLYSMNKTEEDFNSFMKSLKGAVG